MKYKKKKIENEKKKTIYYHYQLSMIIDQNLFIKDTRLVFYIKLHFI